MGIADLEQLLDELRQRYTALSTNPLSLDALTELNALRDEILVMERRVAAEKGEAFAVPVEWPVEWAFSKYPTPLVISNSWQTILVYSAAPEESKGHKGGGTPEGTALLIFDGCVSHQFGSPNDEAIEGHPLFGRGIDVGGCYVVLNSGWLDELKRVNRVHAQFDDEGWRQKKHYVLFFKDVTFECIADGVRGELVDGSAPAAARIALTKAIPVSEDDGDGSVHEDG